MSHKTVRSLELNKIVKRLTLRYVTFSTINTRIVVQTKLYDPIRFGVPVVWLVSHIPLLNLWKLNIEILMILCSILQIRIT